MKKIRHFVENVTLHYLRWHVRESRFWTYYILVRNRLNRLLGKECWSNTVLFPEQDM